MLAGLPVPPDAVDELAGLIRAVGADALAERLEQVLTDDGIVVIGPSTSTSSPSATDRSC